VGVYNSSKVLLLLDEKITTIEKLASQLNKIEKQNKQIVCLLCFAFLTSLNAFLSIIDNNFVIELLKAIFVCLLYLIRFMIFRP